MIVATIFADFVGEAETSDVDETVDLNYASISPGGLIAAASLFVVQSSAHVDFLEVLGEAGCREEGVELESRTNIDQSRQALSSLPAPKTGMDVAGGPHGTFVLAAMLVGSVGTAGYMRLNGPGKEPHTYTHSNASVIVGCLPSPPPLLPCCCLFADLRCTSLEWFPGITPVGLSWLIGRWATRAALL